MRTVRTAVVIKATGSHYILHDIASKITVDGRLRGRMRLNGSRSTSPVVVGDIVDYEFEPLSENKKTRGEMKNPVRGETAMPGCQRKRDRAAVGDVVTGGELSVQTTPKEETCKGLEEADIYGTDGLGRPCGTVVALHPRRNYIIRRASNLSKESHIIAANIDQALLVVSLIHPATSYEFIDRFLVTAEAYHIPATILLNKSDLYTTGDLKEQLGRFIGIYTHAGYDVIELSASRGEVSRVTHGHVWPQKEREEEISGSKADSENGRETSAVSGMGMKPLLDRLHNRVTLLSGNSGVGKSTLIRAIDPSLEVRVGEVSEAHQKGRHTTTFSEMYPLVDGGWLIDTPGIKGFGLIDFDGAEIARYFPELFRLSPNCSYYNCTHTHEPGCAVKEALSRGGVSLSRYESYLKLLDNDEKYRR